MVRTRDITKKVSWNSLFPKRVVCGLYLSENYFTTFGGIGYVLDTNSSYTTIGVINPDLRNEIDWDKVAEKKFDEAAHWKKIEKVFNYPDVYYDVFMTKEDIMEDYGAAARELVKLEQNELDASWQYEHNMYNSFLGSNPYETAKLIQEERVELIGWVDNVPIDYFLGEDYSIGIVWKYKDSEQLYWFHAWKHIFENWRELYPELYKEEI